MKMKITTGFVVLVSFFLISCSKDKATVESMEQIYKQNGHPVETRTLEEESFSVYLKYPCTYKSRSQSTAYAKIGDVVRTVNVKVGDRVNRDDVIIVFSKDNASYQQSRLQYDNALSSFNRMEKLYKESGISKQDYDNARTQLQVAKEALRSIEEVIMVKSPISGTITQLNVQPSSNVQPGSPLFTVSNQNGYEALFYVLPKEIGDIRVGQRAFIDHNGVHLEGVVQEVSMTMDPSIRAFPVKAYFDQSSPMIVSGMNVDISIEAYVKPKTLVIDQKEMVRQGDLWYGYVISDGKAVKRELALGRRQGITYEVFSGLKEGEILVTKGSSNLSAGDKVLVIN